MLRFLLLALLAVGSVSATAEEPALDDPRLVSSLVDYLNKRPDNVYNFNDGTLISAHKKDNVYIIDTEIKITCNPSPCSVEKVKCRGSVRHSADTLEVLEDGTGCELPSDESKVETTSTDELDTLPEIHISLSEPVKLAHEIQMNDQYAGSGEQFVAVRRDSAGGEDWCAGCPIDISLTAEGVPELGNNIILHLDAHLPNEKHILKRILRVQRQAQIVNGVRYTLLAEIDTVSCNKEKEEQTDESCQNNIPVAIICEVSILEKPWIKLSDGSKFRAILSNNCTQEISFGDEGEAISSLNPNKNSDIVKNVVNNLQAVKKINTGEEEITPERFMAVQEQIITDPKEDSVSLFNEPHRKHVLVFVESEQPISTNHYSSQANPSTKSEDNFFTGSKNDSTTELSDDQKQALDQWMGLFSIDNLPAPLERQENQLDEFESQTNNDNLLIKLEVNNSKTDESSQSSDASNSSEEKKSRNVRKKRSLLSPRRVKNEINEKLMNDLAKYGLQTLDEFDSDNIKRVVLQVLDFKTSQRNHSTFYSLKVSAGMSKCMESHSHDECVSMLLHGKHKVCNMEIEVTPDGNRKVNKASCTNGMGPIKRSPAREQLVGGPSTIVLPNDKITELAELSVNHYDLSSQSDNRHKIVNIISAKRQVVAGSLTTIELEIKEVDCKKNQVKLDECSFLKEAISKNCTASIWSRPWLNKNEITIDCNPVNVRSKRQIPGGVNQVTLPNDEISKLAELSVSHYDLSSTSDYHHRVVNIISATTQVVEGTLKKIELEIKEIDCKKNQVKSDKCGFLKGAIQKRCKASIWSRPWLKKNEITIDCNPINSRTKRQIPGGVSPVSLPNDEITKLAELSVNHYDLTSTTDYRHKVVNIISATTQVVSGSLKKIEMEIKEIDCKKNHVMSGECAFLEGAIQKRCIASVWSRPWLNKNEITIDCNPINSRSRRGLKGGINPVSLPNDEITQLAELSVDHYDLTSSTDYRHKVINIISATSQVVEGTLKKIEMEIKEVNCKKNQAKSDECGFLDGAIQKRCKASIWSRPWLNKNEIKIECNPVQSSRTIQQNPLYMSQHTKNLMMQHKKFEKFIEKYSKPYLEDENEYNSRFEIFSKNLDLIDTLNKEELGTATYGVNEFADLSQEEFKSYLGLRTDLRNENNIPFTQAIIPDIDPPSAFDWRDKGAVTPVKNQGSCGSCWAFSVTGNIEGQNMIKNGKLLSLSEQELVDCDKLDEGCNGGLPDNAYRAIEKLGGLELESEYPYDAMDETCHFNKSLARVQISGAVNISSNEDEMVKWLAVNGPMSIGINANAMQFYVGGVSHPPKFLCSPKNLDHGVLIVGYGMKEYPLFKKKMPYWIVKNSWGKSWGEQGYYRVFRGEGTCGLNLMVSSAVM